MKCSNINMKNFLGKINLTAHYSINDKTNWKNEDSIFKSPWKIGYRKIRITP